ncbi:hypothetical protein A1O3_02820 [Capronia epimyces CBS 606.96]|uniref:Uncharacterized protein n=1 Tax=Capronia epimyces CBS 606.96 TaxID=1182542 RepID=W9YB48_9EURO|nr:uncharacterized protein A1O3_02820 [Capronia epimyces CBS 606.96]EXJ89753.1 hypothetical protein A1O3_02820 [Capronia epimyces CBS 606.96]
MRYRVRTTVLLSGLSLFLLINTVGWLRAHRDDSKGPRYGGDELAYAYAYVFYATSNLYACSALVNMHRLRHLFQTQHPIYLLVSSRVSAKYRRQFQEHYNVTVIEQEPPPLATESAPYYRDVLLKLVSFKLHRWAPQLKRIIVLDSDQLVLRSLDELFTQIPPHVELAAPHAYWLPGEPGATSAMIVVSPSEPLWRRMNDTMASIAARQYDMDLLNAEFRHEMTLLPGQYVTLNSHWEVAEIPSWSRFSADQIKWPLDGKGPTSLEKEKSSQSRDDGDEDQTSTSTSTSNDPNTNANSHPSLTKGSKARPPPPASPSPSPSRLTSTVPLRYDRALVDPLTAIFHRDVHVLHFTALAKPWSIRVRTVHELRPDAHPLFAEQFLLWRTAAKALCPALDVDDAGAYAVAGKTYVADADIGTVTDTDADDPSTGTATATATATLTKTVSDRFLDEV